MENEETQETTTERFFDLLEGEEGCNFRYENGQAVHTCFGDFRFSKKILSKFFGLEEDDINEFLKFCKDNGGFCDCEILFNVEDKILNREEN